MLSSIFNIKCNVSSMHSYITAIISRNFFVYSIYKGAVLIYIKKINFIAISKII